MTTVAELITQLQNYCEPDEPIMFQYITADHVDMPADKFAECLEIVDDSVYDDLTNTMLAYLYEVYEAEEEEEDEEEEENH